MADQNLYEIVFLAGDHHGREGFSVWLTPEQILDVKRRFQAGGASGVVKDWQVVDSAEGAIGYEQLVAALERGDYVKGSFPPADTSKNIYLVQATFKPKFFGFKKERQISPNVFMTPEQAKYIEETLSADDRLSDSQVVDMNSNISTKEFFEMLEGHGV
jgi:hypothetical protein